MDSTFSNQQSQSTVARISELRSLPCCCCCFSNLFDRESPESLKRSSLEITLLDTGWWITPVKSRPRRQRYKTECRSSKKQRLHELVDLSPSLKSCFVSFLLKALKQIKKTPRSLPTTSSAKTQARSNVLLCVLNEFGLSRTGRFYEEGGRFSVGPAHSQGRLNQVFPIDFELTQVFLCACARAVDCLVQTLAGSRTNVILQPLLFPFFPFLLATQRCTVCFCLFVKSSKLLPNTNS